jgi:hypothetical protein
MYIVKVKDPYGYKYYINRSIQEIIEIVKSTGYENFMEGQVFENMVTDINNIIYYNIVMVEKFLKNTVWENQSTFDINYLRKCSNDIPNAQVLEIIIE